MWETTLSWFSDSGFFISPLITRFIPSQEHKRQSSTERPQTEGCQEGSDSGGRNKEIEHYGYKASFGQAIGIDSHFISFGGLEYKPG